MIVLAIVSVGCGSATGKKGGVEINGVRWATCNVGAAGAFVASPQEYGEFYNWDDAQNACPEGWRLPTTEELQSLDAAGSTWTTVDGVNGLLFGSGNNTIFLPASGYLHKGKELFYQGKNGYCWSSTPTPHGSAYFLSFVGDVVIADNTDNKSHGMPIRCVAK